VRHELAPIQRINRQASKALLEDFSLGPEQGFEMVRVARNVHDGLATGSAFGQLRDQPVACVTSGTRGTKPSCVTSRTKRGRQRVAIDRPEPGTAMAVVA
jgi:hypothetical protein